jgi:hypothetical protein
VAAGLVTVETSGTSRRLRFLDRVRTALADEAEPADDVSVTSALVGLLAAVRPDLTSPPDVAALGRAVDELANLDGLLDRLAVAGCHRDRLDVVIAAADTWGEDGQWAGGARRVEHAVEAVPDLDPLTRARAVRAWAVTVGTYDGVRRLLPMLVDAVEVATGEDPVLEARLRFHLANAYGYGGQQDEAMAQARRLRELARILDREYVDLGVASLAAVGLLVTGDHAGSRRGLEQVTAGLERLGALSDAARLHRMSSLASRGMGDLPAAHASLLEAERLASASCARGTLATVRGDLAEVLMETGDPAAAEALEGALDASLAVGNLRAAGITRARLGRLRNDAACVAQGVLDRGSPTGGAPRSRSSGCRT